MNTKDITKRSFLHAAGVFLYVFTLAMLLPRTEHILTGMEALFPVFMLLLVIISGATTGYLVLGKPILLYMDGLKREAFRMFFSTLGWLVLFLAITGIVILLG
ncbi:MAG: hypothetical protein AAB458_01430 [Patescibacteria group bacterium]